MGSDIASFYGSSCANNGKDALNTPESRRTGELAVLTGEFAVLTGEFAVLTGEFASLTGEFTHNRGRCPWHRRCARPCGVSSRWPQRAVGWRSSAHPPATRAASVGAAAVVRSRLG
eukprot:9467201-Pyramimonas_sp.AAC.1